MSDLLSFSLIAVVILISTAIAVAKVDRLLHLVERAFLSLSIAATLFIMLFVSAEVLMRYVFNSPIPGHLEGSELLLPVIVFLALSYTQATHGHVGMDLLTDSLPPRGKRVAEILALSVSCLLCALLGFFSYKNAYSLWLYDDVTPTRPHLYRWPSAAAITIGYVLISIRMWIQILFLIKDPQPTAGQEN